MIDVVEVVGPLWGRWGGNQKGGAKATQDSLAEELGGRGGWCFGSSVGEYM